MLLVNIDIKYLLNPVLSSFGCILRHEIAEVSILCLIFGAFFCFFEIGSCSAVQAGLQLLSLSNPPNLSFLSSWDYRDVLLYLACF
jgi:hypothetical protein